MRITPNGQRRAHLAQPVQASGVCRVDVLRQCTTSNVNKCSGQLPTHQPHPVQRLASITGHPRRGRGAGAAAVIARGR